MPTGSMRPVSGRVGVKVLGVEELLAKLVRINTIARLEVGFLMKGAAKYLEETAIEMAPIRTGNLKTSIHATQVAPYTHIVRADTRTGSDPGGEGKSSYEYAGYVEFGTSKMDARPFMQPAVQETVPFIYSGLQAIAARIEAL
jgi:HK97 gp10 family phage protein